MGHKSDFYPTHQNGESVVLISLGQKLTRHVEVDHVPCAYVQRFSKEQEELIVVGFAAVNLYAIRDVVQNREQGFVIRPLVMRASITLKKQLEVDQTPYTHNVLRVHSDEVGAARRRLCLLNLIRVDSEVS